MVPTANPLTICIYALLPVGSKRGSLVAMKGNLVYA